MKEVTRIEYIPEVKDKVYGSKGGTGYISRIYNSARWLRKVATIVGSINYYDNPTFPLDNLKWNTEAKMWMVM
jgi:hypothetical protein